MITILLAGKHINIINVLCIKGSRIDISLHFFPEYFKIMSDKTRKNPGSGLKEMLKLYRYLKPYRGRFALGLLFLLISTGASLMFPKLLGDMVDMGNKGKLAEEISRTGIPGDK